LEFFLIEEKTAEKGKEDRGVCKRERLTKQNSKEYIVFLC